MAALVNGTTARYPELTDIYHFPGSYGGHPSDVVMPAIAAAEYAHASGRELITAIVLAYEIYLRISDQLAGRDVKEMGFDHTTFACLGSAAAAGKLFGLTAPEFSHCISMAVVPNVILRQVRLGDSSMWKAVASGHAARAGVFAAMLARAGMEGPHLPFQGEAGWCDHVAHQRFTLDALGGGDVPFKILDTRLKHRPAGGAGISSILAAEKVAPLKNLNGVKHVSVELYQLAKDAMATGAHRWHPRSRESADHSVPYLVAATLMDGTVTLRSFNDAHLHNPELHALIEKIEVAENANSRVRMSNGRSSTARVSLL